MNGHIHQPGVFWRLDEPTILQLLKNEGWSPVPVTDPAGHVYPIHQHAAHTLVAILHGAMEIKVANETYRCLAGDKLIIPGGAEHAVVTGPDGCTYFWSEQIRS